MVRRVMGPGLSYRDMARAAREMGRTARRAGAETPNLSLDFEARSTMSSADSCRVARVCDQRLYYNRKQKHALTNKDL